MTRKIYKLVAGLFAGSVSITRANNLDLGSCFAEAGDNEADKAECLVNRGFHTEFSSGFNILRGEPVPASLLKDSDSKEELVAESARKVVHKLADRATCKKHFVTRCYLNLNESSTCPTGENFTGGEFDCIKECQPNKVPYPIVCCNKTGGITQFTPVCNFNDGSWGPNNGNADWDSAKAMCEHNNLTLCDLHDLWKPSTDDASTVPYIDIQKLCADTDMAFTPDADAKEMVDGEPQLPFWTSTCCVPTTTLSTTPRPLPDSTHFIARGCYGCGPDNRYCHSVCEPRDARLGVACCNDDSDVLSDVYSACPFRKLGATIGDAHGYCQEFGMKVCSVKQLFDFTDKKLGAADMINASASDRAANWIPNVGGGQDVMKNSGTAPHDIDYNDNDTDGCGGEDNNYERFMMWTDIPCEPPRAFEEVENKINESTANPEFASALWLCRCSPNHTTARTNLRLQDFNADKLVNDQPLTDAQYKALEISPHFGTKTGNGALNVVPANLAVCGFYDDAGVRQCEIHSDYSVPERRADDMCHFGLQSDPASDPARQAPALGCYDIVLEAGTSLQSYQKYNELSKNGMLGMAAAWDYNFAMVPQGASWSGEITADDASQFNAKWIKFPPEDASGSALLRAQSSIKHSTTHVKVASPSGATRCQPLSARFATRCCNQATQMSKTVCESLTGTNFKSADKTCQTLGRDWGLCNVAALHRGVAANSGCNIADNVTMYWTNIECKDEDHDEFLKVSSSILLRSKQVAKAKKQFYGGKDAIY